ncbi:uncharacterized protein [Diadema antillarum]|uniref:uncharacterized protein n=1 Tax=Diadema antillarum TaxID=105358 RepID=UPI003A8AAC0A
MSADESQANITDLSDVVQPIIANILRNTTESEQSTLPNSSDIMPISTLNSAVTNDNDPNAGSRSSNTTRRGDDTVAVTKTGPIDGDINITHVWALWGVVIAAGLLVVVIVLIMTCRCVIYVQKSKSETKKPRRRLPRISRKSPKLQLRSTGVMADHREARKDFFHSLERGNAQARRQEATQRWLRSNLATSLQYMEGSGSGGQPASYTEQECIPMYETSFRHGELDRIPENKQTRKEYSFTRTPLNQNGQRIERPIIHHQQSDNVNGFVRVIPMACNLIRDQNANISFSPTTRVQSQHQPTRPRWHTTVRPVTFSHLVHPGTRAVFSEPPRYAASRLPMRRHHRPTGGDTGARGFRPPASTGKRWRPTKQTLPKFNLAGEVILTSSEPSLVGVPRTGHNISPKWDDWSYENTVFEPNTPRLMVPTNSPETDQSSSRSLDSLNGMSAGASQCNVSSDGSLTVTVGTSKRTSYEWDFYDPTYQSRPVRFMNGAYMPVIGSTQYWV